MLTSSSMHSCFIFLAFLIHSSCSNVPGQSFWSTFLVNLPGQSSWSNHSGPFDLISPSCLN
jgi:hypothetical protein